MKRSAPKQQVARLFLVLICLQLAHSIEEYWFDLWAVLEPAKFLSSLISDNLKLGFGLANVAVVSFGFWCYWARVRLGHQRARFWVGLWAVAEMANGIGHPLMALIRGSYFPGAVTAPLLLVTAVLLARKAGLLSSLYQE